MVEGSPRWRRGTAAQEAAFAAAEAAVAAAESPTAAADRSELDARQVLALRLSIAPLSHPGYLLAESYCLVALRGFALHSKSQPTDITAISSVFLVSETPKQGQSTHSVKPRVF